MGLPPYTGSPDAIGASGIRCSVSIPTRIEVGEGISSSRPVNRANPAERLKKEKTRRGLTSSDLIEAFIGHTEYLDNTGARSTRPCPKRRSRLPSTDCAEYGGKYTERRAEPGTRRGGGGGNRSRQRALGRASDMPPKASRPEVFNRHRFPPPPPVIWLRERTLPDQLFCPLHTCTAFTRRSGLRRAADAGSSRGARTGSRWRPAPCVDRS